MAVTIRYAVLKHQQKEDGTYNVKIRITKDRKSAYMPTNYFVTSRQVDRDLKITDSRLALNIDTYILELRKILVDNESILDSLSAKDLVKFFQSQKSDKSENLDYLSYLNSEIEDLVKNNKLNQSNYKAVYNHLENYSKGRLNFTDITPSFLFSFENYLRKEGVGDSGIIKYIGCIRASFNRAKNIYNDEDRGIVKIPNNPFSRYKLPKEADSGKRDAGIELLVDLYNYEPKTGLQELAKDMFFLSFYLVGINARDLHNDELNISKGRLTYQRSKTKDIRSDKAEISIKLEPEVLPLLDKYKGFGNNVLFICERFGNSKAFNSSLSKGFKQIRENIKEKGKNKYNNLTFYSARHSWATIASHNCNIIDSHIAKCLNHKSLDFKTTNKYIKRDWSLIDKCNRQVLDFVKTKIDIE